MPRELSLLRDERHWRDRANEARAVAEGLNDPETRRLMLGIAGSYDALAERAALRAQAPAGR